jgi:hypothetical protein
MVRPLALPTVCLLLSACTPDPGGINIHNADPRAEITSHADGDTPEAGLRTFTGTVEDPDHQADELELTWLYDGEEACPPITPDASGNTSCEIFLASGEHTVSLQVEDPLGGLGSDKVTLEVEPYGEPWVEIDAPIQGGIYYSDALMEFSGTVGDASDDPSELVVLWESNLDGVLDLDAQPDASGGVSDFGHLSEGEHAITLTVENTGGNIADASVIIEVNASNTAPTCSIDAPATGSEYEYGETVLFEATVDDVDVPEDWLTATFTSHLVGELGSITPNSDGSVTLPLTELSVGAHNVTLSVADEQGLTCTASVVVSVLDCPTIWYADDDGDGFGDPDSTATGCEPPSGYVEDDNDCDDRDAAVNPDATEICNEVDDDCDGDIDDDDSGLDTSTASTWYADADADGYGDSAVSSLACDQPARFLADNTDCDDADATAYPGAPELCDGADDDCDGTVDEDDALDASTWYADSDGDGYGDSGSTTAACSQPSAYTSDASDCDDADAGINPAAGELCDSVDNDCDGDVDEDDATDASTWYADLDGDGYGDASSTTAACAVPSGFVADDSDCDDSRSSVNPAADEYCNGRDDDCDTDTDEASAVDASTWYADSDSDGYGDDLSTTLACSLPTGFVAYGGDCNDADAAFNPGASESDCADPADYNCDGSTAYADNDGDGWAACEECDDTDAAISPDAVEQCDGADNDCDGDVDEADASDASTWYADSDGDGYGDAGSTALGCTAPSGHVSDATDCDDGDAGAYPGSLEYCDGADNDCDGTVDEADATDASTWYADSDGDGYGDSASTQDACTAPSGYVADASDCDDGDASANPGASEYCDSVDNDCDGTVDEDDALDATTWYLDADSDGYGGTLYDVTACTAPSGFVSDSSDCNDGIASTNPGAAEYCDGADNDCDSVVDEDDAVDASTWYADDDGDGFGDAGSTTAACSVPSGYSADATDCDDADADTNPDEDEYCDGHDDDCDGDIDEDDAVDADTWYLDSDGDGYGLDASTTDACVQPSGYAGYGGDCDDSDTAYNPGASETDCADPNDYNCDGSTAYADVDGDGWAACEECDDYDYNTNPDAEEYCDGHDDDCDGDIDEDDAVDASTWYADVDGDGFGDASITTSACTAPSGFTSDDTDCDDGDASTYPGAAELCGDGVVNDCEGVVEDAMALCFGDLDLADAEAVFYGEAANDLAGREVSAAGDQNGDGVDDLLIASYGNGSVGAVYLLFSPHSGEYDLWDADVKLVGEATDDNAGRASAHAGDVDGDGYDDLIIGARGNDRGGSGAGAAFLVLGPVTADMSLVGADAVLVGENDTDSAGNAVAGAGDVNADGYDDLLIGAYSWASGHTSYGAAYLMHGPISGEIELSAADAMITGGSSSEFGGSVVGAGDTDGDGVPDLLIGARHYGSFVGEAYLFHGPVSGSLTNLDADARMQGEGRNDQAGSSVAYGDINNDGYSDVVVAAPNCSPGSYNIGAVYVVFGPTSGSMDLGTSDVAIYGAWSTSGIGDEVEAAGDLNADGYSDLIIGEDDDAGEAFVFLGPLSGTLDDTYADSLVSGTSSGDCAGESIAYVGDPDQDGFDDFLIGAHSNDYTDTDAGAAYLVTSASLFGY